MIILLVALLTAHTLSCCKKDDPKPEPDPNGADHMTTIINGQEWEANCEPSWPGLGCRKVNCKYYEDTKEFSLSNGGGSYSVSFSRSSTSGGVVLGENKLPFRIDCSLKCVYFLV